MISVTSVIERSTSCNCRQRSQAAGPIHVKFGGRDNEVIPASRKQHSGGQRVKLAELYSDCQTHSDGQKRHMERNLWGAQHFRDVNWINTSKVDPVSFQARYSKRRVGRIHDQLCRSHPE